MVFLTGGTKIRSENLLVRSCVFNMDSSILAIDEEPHASNKTSLDDFFDVVVKINSHSGNSNQAR